MIEVTPEQQAIKITPSSIARKFTPPHISQTAEGHKIPAEKAQFYIKSQFPPEMTLLKSTVMQIEKALTKDCLYISKVS